MLSLNEKFFLITIDDDKGKVTLSASTVISYGLAGAFLAELTLEGKLCLEDEKLVVLDGTPTGDEIMDDVLAIIAESDKPRKPIRWIKTLSGKKLPRRVAKRLAAKNIIQIEKKRYLWMIPYEAYPIQDASAKYWVKQHLREIILGGVAPVSRDVVLLSLINACRLLNLVFTKDERKAALKKVEDLVKEEPFGDSIARTLKEIDMAAAVVIISA
jgi:Golgi phosphoprotein 3